MRKSVKSLLVVCAFAGASPATANLVANGGFEEDPFSGGSSRQVPGSGLGEATLSGWTVSGGQITWYNNNFNLAEIALSAHNGNFAVNLGDGSVRSVSASPTVDLLPFQEYQVSYWVGNYSANNGSDAVVTVSVLDGSSNTIFVSEGTARPPSIDEDSNWQSATFSFITDGTSNTINFAETGGLTYVGLDDVRVVAVPEPSTWELALAGFMGLGLAGLGRARKMTPA